MRSALVIAGIVLAAASATAHAVTPLPARGDHSVYDAAGVLDAATEAQIEALDNELFQKAGVAIVVVTVPRLEGETIEQLAVRVQHDWGVGVKGKDESVVLALSVADRKIFIATGYGSEGYLPDGKVGEIRDHARPKLRANDYAGGILQAVAELAGVAAAAHHVTLTGAPHIAPAPSDHEDIDGWASMIILVMVVFAMAFLSYLGRGGRGGGGGGGGGLGAFLGGAVLGRWLGGRGDGGFGGGGFGGGGGGGFGGFGGGSGGGGGAGGDF